MSLSHHLRSVLGPRAAAEIEAALSGGGVSLDPLDFPGDEGDPLSGATLGWDADQYDLVLMGRPGSDYSGLSVLNPDNLAQVGTVNPGYISLAHGDQGIVTLWPGQFAVGHVYDPGASLDWAPDYGLQLVDANSGTLFLTPNDGNELGFAGLALFMSSVQAATHPDVLHFSEYDGGLGYSGKPAFSMKLDGAMHWGPGGATVPDVALSRVTGINAPGLKLDGELYFGLDSTWSTTGTEIVAGHAYGQDATLGSWHLFADIAGGGHLQVSDWVGSRTAILGAGGLQVTSPDGSHTKTIGIDNTGALVAV